MSNDRAKRHGPGMHECPKQSKQSTSNWSLGSRISRMFMLYVINLFILIVIGYGSYLVELHAVDIYILVSENL